MSAPAHTAVDAAGSDLDAFRAEVRDWLATVAAPRSATARGPADLAVFRNLSDEQERLLLDAARNYRRQRFDA